MKMINFIKFIIPILLVLIIIYIYNIYEDFSLYGSCYNKKTGIKKHLDKNDLCYNVCYCINGIPNDVPNACMPDTIETINNCKSCDNGEVPMNGYCKDDDNNDYISISDLSLDIINSLSLPYTEEHTYTSSSFDDPTYPNSAFIKTTQIDSDYKYITFLNDGTDEPIYTVNFPVDTTCDILIIGGGGAGSAYVGGGGGAGELVIITNCILNGSYNIKVGKGGIGGNLGDGKELSHKYAIKGFNSSFDTVIAQAGGTNTDTTTDKNGGSGAGGAPFSGEINRTGTVGKGSKYNNNLDTFASGTVYSFGNDGADGNKGKGAGGGGGGAGGAGGTGNDVGNGGDGIYKATLNGVEYNLKKHFSPNTDFGVLNSLDSFYYIAGGGGGGSSRYDRTGKGGKGGGANGGANGGNNNAINNTGSGGGGGQGGGISGQGGNGGNGGSGIVIIRYSTKKQQEPTYPNSAFITTTTINSDYKYITFLNNKIKNQTIYTVNFPEETTCDILVVGGGGAGGSAQGSGGGGSGGGGDVIEYKDLKLSGKYKIFVGRGGLTFYNNVCSGGENGFNSKIMKDGNDYIIAAGGAGGGVLGEICGMKGTVGGEIPTATFQDPITNETITTSGGGGGVIWYATPRYGNGVSGRGGFNDYSTKNKGGAGGGAVGDGGNCTGWDDTYLKSKYGQGGEGYKSYITGELIGYGGGGSTGQSNPPASWTETNKIFLSPSIDGGGSFNKPGIDGRGGGGSMGSNGGSGIVIIKYRIKK